jgi:hypothetical protein
LVSPLQPLVQRIKVAPMRRPRRPQKNEVSIAEYVTAESHLSSV